MKKYISLLNYNIIIWCRFLTYNTPQFILRSFLLYPYIFLPAPHNFVNSEINLHNFEIWECVMDSSIRKWIMSHLGCSGSKVCINYWFLDCWILKPNFYYGLVDLWWFFSITDFWIRNAYFELRIGESGMIFSIMDVLHFFILD